MSDVYVTMIVDRHIDPYPEVYTTLDAAIEAARDAASRHAAHPETIREEPPPNDPDDPHPWLFYVKWSTESADRAWVVKEEVRT